MCMNVWGEGSVRWFKTLKKSTWNLARTTTAESLFYMILSLLSLVWLPSISTCVRPSRSLHQSDILSQFPLKSAFHTHTHRASTQTLGCSDGHLDTLLHWKRRSTAETFCSGDTRVTEKLVNWGFTREQMKKWITCREKIAICEKKQKIPGH